MNIQNKMQEIHHKFGVSEKANYLIQLFVEKLLKEQKDELSLSTITHRRGLLDDFPDSWNSNPKNQDPIKDSDIEYFMDRIC